MAVNPVALILGAGPRVGQAVAKKFASQGFKVAIVSRTGTNDKTDEGFLSLKADFANPETIPPVFTAVKTEFQTAPSVVVYNAAALTFPPIEGSVFSTPYEAVAKDVNINTISAYVAAQQAVSGWETLPAETKKSFIYTGNILNVSILPMPMGLTLGIGKSASAFWVGFANAMYASKGFR
jgi:NAD(P)-dependent dehydrogenase (short-subunit alcohol dehydrogenase family)